MRHGIASLLAFLLPIGIALGILLPSTTLAQGQEKEVVFNPYEDVNWSAEHLKGNFHTHTAESPDASRDPVTVIKDYHDKEYNVLALTDHNHVTWPWAEYGQDPDELDMIPVPGNELSRHDHNLSLFTEYPSPVRDSLTTRLHTSLEEVGATGGLNVLAHPGRYWEPGEQRVPDGALAKYMGLFRQYDSLVGMEVHNQKDRYPWDRRLWDALLEKLMPERPVWGFANDDSHQEPQIGFNANWFPLSDPSGSGVQTAIEDGRFYFSTVTTHPEKWQNLKRTPQITDVQYDQSANVLHLTATVDGEPVAPEQVRWISNGGKVVATGKRIDLDDTEGLTTYLRAEIRSTGALTYTQPFGLGER